ncbi:MAG: hypothetical protein EPN39_09730 [Chitinophagaceae bacterium]|nr:MAG: hypothetical protein EPN39_09730 [Chitinophagaceae bacterium]
MKKEKYYTLQKGRASTVREDAIPYHAGQKSEMVIYQTKDHHTEVAVRFEEDTVWLTQKQMADLFDRNRVAITQHIGNIFKEEELDKEVVCKEFLQTTRHGAIEGKTQEAKTKFYNLDVIISVGYRVKSQRGTQFRQWATQRLKDYLAKGYAINQKRLLELQQAIQLISGGGSVETLQLQEAKGLLEIQCRLVKDSQGHFDFAQCPKMRSLSEVETNTSQVFSLN